MPKAIDQIREEIARLNDRRRINKDKLDEELVEHADLFYDAGMLFVKTKAAADTSKVARDDAYNRAASKARKDLAADTKVTDKAVDAAASRDPGYLAAVEEYQNACLLRDECEVLYDSFRQRSYMLEPLVSLHNGGYFGGNIQDQFAKDRAAKKKPRE